MRLLSLKMQMISYMLAASKALIHYKTSECQAVESAKSCVGRFYLPKSHISHLVMASCAPWQVGIVQSQLSPMQCEARGV